ncbi:MAG: ATP synthase F1 subunit gamma [Bacteroidales bacterium]|nr:ATP synthase F1 subunit gamma [Bacteroidales bacterium]
MNLKEVKHRILSVKSTQKITSAMKLVSSAKLRRTQSAVENLRPYQYKLDSMLNTLLSGGVQGAGNELTAVREPKRVVLVAVSSDTGLCGAFNSNISHLMAATVNEHRSAGAEVVVYTVGKKMYDAVKRLGIEPCTVLMPQAGSPRYNEVASVAYELVEQFRSGSIDKVELVYTRFESMSRLVPVTEPFLPLVPRVASSADESPCDGVIFEPGRIGLLEALLPKTIALHLFTSLLNSAVSEHASRMIAMQLATDNADELISELTLEYNKRRQQAITGEILDIVAGSAHEG